MEYAGGVAARAAVAAAGVPLGLDAGQAWTVAVTLAIGVGLFVVTKLVTYLFETAGAALMHVVRWAIIIALAMALFYAGFFALSPSPTAFAPAAAPTPAPVPWIRPADTTAPVGWKFFGW